MSQQSFHVQFFLFIVLLAKGILAHFSCVIGQKDKTAHNINVQSFQSVTTKVLIPNFSFYSCNFNKEFSVIKADKYVLLVKSFNSRKLEFHVPFQ